MSLPFGADPKNGRGTQASDSMPKDGDIHGSHHHERPENTNPHYNEYATILKTHLGIVESELSRLKSTQISELGVAEKYHTAREFEVGEKDMHVQEARALRVHPWEWRGVKNKGGIIRSLPALIVSSNGHGRPRRGSTKRRSTRNNDTLGSGNSILEEDPPFENAYRLAINSKILLNLLNDCTGMDFPEDRNVWLRPFKYLVAYETEIRQTLQDVEVTFDQFEAGSRLSDQIDSSQPNSEVSIPGAKPMREGEELMAGAAELAPHAMDASSAKVERDHLRCLVEFMDTDMQDIFDVKRQVADQTLKEVAFEHLWLLYRPGDLVYSTTSPEESKTCQAYRVLHVTGGRPILDTANKSKNHAVRNCNWDRESETEENVCDNIRGSHSNVTPFIIDCFSVDFDGDRLGPKPMRLVIPEYSGKRKVDALEVCLSFFQPQYRKVYQTMVERGRRFTQLASRAHKRYSGMTLRESRDLWDSDYHYGDYTIHEQEVNSEVMIDQAAAAAHYRKTLHKRIQIDGGVISVQTKADWREVFDPFPAKRDKRSITDVFDDSIIDVDRREDFGGSTTLLRYRSILEPSLSDDFVMLLPFRVYGYAMLNRKWLPLNIDSVYDITPDQVRMTAAGYKDLILPRGHKKLLQAIVKNQVRDPKRTAGRGEENGDEFQMDVVKGKGKGLIILLHGAPGVGKTSTAECMAAQLQRPLLPITCGDVSTDVKEAEETLQEYCALAHRWRCVLLLDEADVFLAKREKGDITRNGLVSVFLRVLEYFSGVIILTTNRVGEFDEAFRSRIHVSLYYPKLDQSATLNIWERNLLRLRDSGLQLDFSEDEIRKFAEDHWLENIKNPSRHWNGRQIKNAFQTALALANWDFYEEKQGQNLERPLLSARHFNRVAQTSAHFDDYISDVHNISEDTWSILAARDEIRKDTHPAMIIGRSETQDFDNRSGRTAPARRGAGNRDTRAVESRKVEGGSDKLRQLELELEIEKLKQAKSKEKVQAQAEDDEDEGW